MHRPARTIASQARCLVQFPSRSRRVLLAALALASLAAAARAAPPPCAPLATASLRDVAGFLLVPVDLDGAAASVLIDTGSDAGLIDGGAVRALGLAPGTRRLATLEGTGGGGRAVPVVLVPRMLLGGLAIRNLPMPVGSLPEAPNVSPPVVGLIGGDLLGRFAVGIDVPDGRFELLPDTPRCAAPLAPGPADTIPLEASGDRRMLTARLDGLGVTALLDTGARSRIVATRTALAVGVDPATLAAEPGGVASGIDLRDEIYHWHRFRSLRIGTATERRPLLTVMRLSGSAADMLLGADWFSRRRVLISYATNRMFVQTVAPH